MHKKRGPLLAAPGSGIPDDGSECPRRSMNTAFSLVSFSFPDPVPVISECLKFLEAAKLQVLISVCEYTKLNPDMVGCHHVYSKKMAQFSAMNESTENLRLLKFGQQIEKLCKERDLSIPDLAHLMETDYSWLSKIIKGQVDLRLSTAWRIADALQVDVKDLFQGKK